MPKLPFAAKPQFSLRLLLVIVTALCIALSVWGIIPAERQRRLVKAIEAVGGSVAYFEPDSESPLQRWLPRDYFDDIAGVVLDSRQVTDDMLTRLVPLRTLLYLVLDNSQITDEGLVHLERMTHLAMLSLSGTEVGDAGLAHLQGLASLRNLYIDNTRITDDGVARLQKALPNCKIWQK